MNKQFLKSLLNQDAIWKRVVNIDAYGTPTMDAIPIKVRWENKRKLIIDGTGKEVVSEATCFCLEPIRTDDYLVLNGSDKEWVVKAVEDLIDGDGSIVYREVSV